MSPRESKPRRWHRWAVLVLWEDRPNQTLGYTITRRGADRAMAGMERSRFSPIYRFKVRSIR